MAKLRSVTQRSAEKRIILAVPPLCRHTCLVKLALLRDPIFLLGLLLGLRPAAGRGLPSELPPAEQRHGAGSRVVWCEVCGASQPVPEQVSYRGWGEEPSSRGFCIS